MEISELKKKKEELESNISRQIREFEKDTACKVKGFITENVILEVGCSELLIIRLDIDV